MKSLFKLLAFLFFIWLVFFLPIFRSANPKLFPTLPYLPHGNPGKHSGLMLPPHSCLLPPDHPDVFLMRPQVECQAF